MSKQPQSPAAVSADEKLAHIQDLMGHMQELAQRAASGQCTSEECAELQQELVGLRTEIERITGVQK